MKKIITIIGTLTQFTKNILVKNTKFQNKNRAPQLS